jgi:cytochrome c peroxidase
LKPLNALVGSFPNCSAASSGLFAAITSIVTPLIRNVIIRPDIPSSAAGVRGVLHRRKVMRDANKSIKATAITGLFLFSVAFVAQGFQGGPAINRPNTGMADPDALMNAFDRYFANLPTANGESFLKIPLTGLRGLTSESFNAGGSVHIDLTDGSVVSQITGLVGEFDLWLIDNRSGPGQTTFAEPQDLLLKVGTYSGTTGPHTLSVTLGGDRFSEFFADRAFVVRKNESPTSSFVLTGSSTTFDRLLQRQVRFKDDASSTAGFDPRAALTRGADFARLVAQGREIFLNEQFAGNGRTCGTCHVESNNFTIDPEFISTLPQDDPLFVAENDPALGGLEDPILMRKFGLILVNADGFEAERKFTLRAVQNVQALGNSRTRPDPGFAGDFTSNGRNADPPERLGWGNDGAPLRDFALVAIAQHATKTLGRNPGDFRVPTDEELDAMVAYQDALGRQEDFNLPTLELKSILAGSGKALYLDTGNVGEPGHKNCNACHFNGGGTAAFSLNPQQGSPGLDSNPHGGNVAAPTKVNEIPLALTLALPRDGGFGQIFLPLFGGFGNAEDIGPPVGLVQAEEFNSPSVVESADTAPFFHNHTVEDLESSVAFYGTPAFQSGIFSIGRRLIPITISQDPKDPEVQAIAAFLRVLNALENIRSSISVAERGRTMKSGKDARELSALSQAETIDAIEVLSQGAFTGSHESAIRQALAHLSQARQLLNLGQRLPTRVAVDNALEHAARSLRAAREALADPSTLPPTYRN